MNHKSKLIVYTKRVVLIIFAASIILPILIACFFAVPVGDDFSNIVFTYLARPHNKPFIFWVVWDYYNGTQGCFLPSFYSALTMPIFYLYGLSGLHIQLFIVACLFFGSVFFASYEFVKTLGEEKKLLFLCISLMVLVFPLFYGDISEVFYWATASSYLFSVSFVFFAIGCYFRYKRKKRGLIIAIIIAFLSGGAVLDEAVITCTVLFLFTFHLCVFQRKMEKTIWITISAFIGSLVNVLAPGNYVRHGFDSSASFTSEALSAARMTIKRLLYEIGQGYKCGLLVLVAILSFCLGIRLFAKSEIKCKLPGLVMVYACIAIFLTDFPVVFGYMSSVINTRNVFVEHIAINLFTVIVCMYFGGYVVQTFKMDRARVPLQTVMIAGGIAVLLIETGFRGIADWIPYKMLIHEMNGDFQYIYDAEIDMLNTVKESKEDDVVVYSRNFNGYKWCNIATNKLRRGDYWRNSEIVAFYGKKSLSRIMDLNEWIRIFYEYHGIELTPVECEQKAHGIDTRDERVFSELYQMFDSDYYQNNNEYVKKAYSVFLNRTDTEISNDNESVSTWIDHISNGDAYRYEFIMALLNSDEFRKSLYALD